MILCAFFCFLFLSLFAVASSRTLGIIVRPNALAFAIPSSLCPTCVPFLFYYATLNRAARGIIVILTRFAYQRSINILVNILCVFFYLRQQVSQNLTLYYFHHSNYRNNILPKIVCQSIYYQEYLDISL